MYEVDARGLSCPEPVMLTQAALKSHGNDTVKVLVTEPHSKANVEKFARSKMCIRDRFDGVSFVVQANDGSAANGGEAGFDEAKVKAMIGQAMREFANGLLGSEE